MNDRAIWNTLLICCLAGAVCGAAVGGVANAINSLVSWDCFAITLSWDGTPAPLHAIAKGLLEGGKSGFLFGVAFAIAAGASTHLQATPRFFASLPKQIIAIIAACGLLGGMTAAVVALVWPRVWGFWLIGVPARVNLPRFAWVAGSTAGLYAGWGVAITFACVVVHRRWIRAAGPRPAFGVISATDVKEESNHRDTETQRRECVTADERR